MRNLLIALIGVLVGAVIVVFGYRQYEKLGQPDEKPGEMSLIDIDHELVTVNTTRIGSDDPVETAVAVAQMIYPVTEEENNPGAVVLVNRNELAEVIAAASRVQHFPVNAPLLYVDEDSIPALTRDELLRLGPEGVPMDRNVQVYIVGTIGDAVRDEVESLGFRTRVLTADDPIALTEVLDDWTSTQHGDHRNEVAVLNLDHLEQGVPVAFWNAHRGDGLVYVTDDGIPQTTIDILRRRANGPWLYLFGDESVISEEIARELAQYGHVTRLKGADAGATSAYFAAFLDEGRDWEAWFFQGARVFGWGIGEPGHNAVFVNLDGPAGWQNALPATTLSHMGKHAPALVIDTDSIPADVRSYLEITKPYPTAPQEQLLNHGWIIGGEETISWETQVELDRLLDPYLPLPDDASEDTGGSS